MLVSGGTQGVGAGVARAAAREGASVVVTGRRPEGGEALVGELATGATRCSSGPTSPTSRRPRRRGRGRRVRPGRLLVNSAGLTTRGTLLDTTPELFDAHIAVNLRGPFFTMQAACATWSRRRSPGTIVNVISSPSTAGSRSSPVRRGQGRPRRADRNAAHAHRWDRIRVNGLDIGWTATEGEDATSGRPRGRRRLARRGRATCRWASSARSTRSPTSSSSCCRPRSGVVTGSVIDWDQMVVGGRTDAPRTHRTGARTRSRHVHRPVAMSEVKIAGAPISWGVCEVPGWGYQLGPEGPRRDARGRAARHRARARRFLPAEPDAMATVLAQHGLQAVGGFSRCCCTCRATTRCPRSSGSSRATSRRTPRPWCCPSTGPGRLRQPPRARREGLADAAGQPQPDQPGRGAKGIHAVLHPHVGTMIENTAEVQRVLDGRRSRSAWTPGTCSSAAPTPPSSPGRHRSGSRTSNSRTSTPARRSTSRTGAGPTPRVSPAACTGRWAQGTWTSPRSWGT